MAGAGDGKGAGSRWRAELAVARLAVVDVQRAGRRVTRALAPMAARWASLEADPVPRADPTALLATLLRRGAEAAGDGAPRRRSRTTAPAAASGSAAGTAAGTVAGRAAAPRLRLVPPDGDGARHWAQDSAAPARPRGRPPVTVRQDAAALSPQVPPAGAPVPMPPAAASPSTPLKPAVLTRQDIAERRAALRATLNRADAAQQTPAGASAALVAPASHEVATASAAPWRDQVVADGTTTDAAIGVPDTSSFAQAVAALLAGEEAETSDSGDPAPSAVAPPAGAARQRAEQGFETPATAPERKETPLASAPDAAAAIPPLPAQAGRSHGDGPALAMPDRAVPHRLSPEDPLIGLARRHGVDPSWP